MAAHETKLFDPTAVNHRPIDQFTLLHLGTGLLSGHLGMNFSHALAFAILWEIGENAILKQVKPGMFPYPTNDTYTNAVVDIIAFMGGWWLTGRSPARVTHALADKDHH